MIVTARLIKKATDDGLMEAMANIELGREYQIELDSLRMVKGYNFIEGKMWEREMVKSIRGGWIPTELLDWDLKQDLYPIEE